MIKILTFFLVLVTSLKPLYSSGSKADSLIALASKVSGHEKADLYNQIAWEYKASYPDKALKYTKAAYAIAKDLNYQKAFTFSLYLLGWINDYKGYYEPALAYYDSALVLYKKSNDMKGISSVYNNIGNIYSFQGDYDKALSFLLKSLSIKEKLNDKSGIAKTFNNIGIIYENKLNYPKALEYYTKSLEIKKQLNSEDEYATSYSNIAGMLQLLGREKEALEYYTQALKIYTRTKNNNGLALTYNSLGSLYVILKDYSLAINFQKEALYLHELSGDKLGIVYSMLGLGDIYYRKGEYEKATTALNDAVIKSKEIGALKEQMDGLKTLSAVYEEQNNFSKALQAHKGYLAIKDTLEKEQSNRLIAEMQTKYETVQKEKKITELNKEKEIKSKEAKQERNKKNFYSGMALLAIILVIVILKGYRAKKKSNTILEEKNKLIEEKNKEIAESIAYAKYIQDAALPSIKITDLIADSFVLYKPKDIVSGDFYWFEKDDSHIYLITADCTGHGIPGGFMSMIGTILLNEIYNEKKVREPAAMLKELNQLLQLSLKQTSHTQSNRDGMDISIARLNTHTLELSVASANRPVYIIKSGGLHVIAPNKAAIGGYTPIDFVFDTQTLKLEKGDNIYLFSDGYADQFGGNQGKKLMTGRFKQQLTSISNEPMEVQKENLDEFFEKWKGHHQQVDDVLVIGAKV